MMLMHWRKMTIVVILHHLWRRHMRRRIWVHGNGMVARKVDEMAGYPTVWDSMHRRRSGHVEIDRMQGRV